MRTHESEGDRAWLRINQAVDFDTALKIMQMLKGS